ncbi:hypothetical protein HOL21_04770 [Candidatus Woesearchaeota archaeon]|nr:hypothetical protein [Candidatus Woesearchaeota archaeon]MBT5924877.1 hypothetical protein [Candidatus Woesearchaeota archaeon]MBT6367928.1 hypothetical protein [Candidatus Woesearchaeota archaeon]MBT7763152.1 hypothetical protein [Candidatus Woesearchaeota archaeon]
MIKRYKIYLLVALLLVSSAFAVDFTVNCGTVPDGGGPVACEISSGTTSISGFSATVSSGSATLSSVSFSPFIDISDLTQSPPAIGVFALSPDTFTGTLNFDASASFTLAITGIQANTAAGQEEASFPVVQVESVTPTCTALPVTECTDGWLCPDNVVIPATGCPSGQECSVGQCVDIEVAPVCNAFDASECTAGNRCPGNERIAPTGCPSDQECNAVGGECVDIEVVPPAGEPQPTSTECGTKEVNVDGVCKLGMVFEDGDVAEQDLLNRIYSVLKEEENNVLQKISAIAQILREHTWS